MKRNEQYNYAFLDEGSKREIRRCILKAVAIPGYQVPFGSRELPIGRGWGTGGIQLTLSLIGPSDILKVIDQGSDDSVNAVNIKKFVKLCTDAETTESAREATLIQSRHRIPETPLRNDQILVFQVPIPEPLRIVEPKEEVTKKMHAEMDYAPIWLQLYESIVKYGKVTIPTEYPCTVENRYIMNPSPIPKFDNPKLHQSECLYLFGAGREKKIYAIPPYTNVESLAFDDVPLNVKILKANAAGSAAVRIHILMRCSMKKQVKKFISVQIQLIAGRYVLMTIDEKPVLSVNNLTVRYGRGCEKCRTHLEKNRCTVCGTVWAANNISLDVYPGEVLGIVGESGSGKSTLMQSLYFDIEPTSGEAFLDGYKNGSESIWTASAAEKRHIKNSVMGMVYQNPIRGLRMEYSAASNIAEKLISAGNRNAHYMTKRAEELLSAVEILTSRMSEAPKNFSGGMQQRVQISKALANNPSVLLLDEVTTGLDLSVQARVLDLIRKIKAEYGISILLVSHDLAVIRMLADRTVVMLDGKIIESGLTDQILEDPQQAYTQQLVHSLL